MKKALVIVLTVLSYNCFSLLSQTADNKYSRPLIDVLADIELQFNIKIKYDKEMIDNKTLNYADWRIKPWSIDETLYAVLAPFDYTFVMDNGKYKIKSFEYARTNVIQGEKFLKYLESKYNNKSSFEKRKAELIPCFREALRLSPLPQKPNSKVILTSKRIHDGYTVENFAIETLPGIYVCGSIYKPLKIKDKCPVMLNPNGHFGQGRYREDQQKRCAMQARMGIISASWDIFAWGESLLQFDGTLHRLSAAHSIQTLNSIRILDYLLSLKESDPKRVGITGGSGGGSMTMMMAAIDERITLSIPVVMLASHFNGGCPCESGMPTHLCGNRTNNAEVAALFAPKPQLIISDGKDWSSSVPSLEYPFIQRVYGFNQSRDNIKNVHLVDEGHDYGPSKRIAMYDFIADKFRLNNNFLKNIEGQYDENKVAIEKEWEMYAFGKNGENLPPNAIKGKDALINILIKVGIEK